MSDGNYLRLRAMIASYGIDVDYKRRFLGDLFYSELWWRNHQPWLLTQGYSLRPRYEPNWIPSWQRDPTKMRQDAEDSVESQRAQIIDATKLPEGRLVALKRYNPAASPTELPIGLRLSSPPLSLDPRNHAVHIYGKLDVPDCPDEGIIVMDIMRKYDDPKFETVGEVVDFFQQMFEGLRFFHQHHIIHGDCNSNNIMMDPKSMFPDMYHPSAIDRSRDLSRPAHYISRTLARPKYYFVDFGISREFDASELPVRIRITLGGDKSPPEHAEENGSCDPFPTDVYYLGNLAREEFLQVKRGFSFMKPLVDAMVQNDPAKRPDMDAVVDHLALIQNSLSSFKLRSRVSDRDEWAIMWIAREVIHWTRQLHQIAQGIPPLGRLDPILLEDDDDDDDDDDDEDENEDDDEDEDDDSDSDPQVQTTRKT